MKIELATVALVTLSATVSAAPGKRQLGTATVSLAAPSGTPSQLASGFIYGIPDNGNQASTAIPGNFFTDIGFKNCRAGGAQLAQPNRGWGYNEAEYPGRFASALSNYRTTRKYGGTFTLLPHDLWGADSLNPNGISYPGDNGDWSSYDRFLRRVVSDLTANNMVAGLIWDIWNEPDGDNFWARSDQQYLELWGRTYAFLRREFKSVLITGPSLAVAPAPDNTLWKSWTSFVSRNASVPDYYSWHQLNPAEDPAIALKNFDAFRTTNRLPQRTIYINEYAAPDEQRPSISTWYLSRFERLNMRGLRANWAYFGALHDFMGNLLGKNGATYFPNGEWQLLKYYNNMRNGLRVATTPSTDGKFEVFATAGKTSNTVKILAGTRGTTDVYDITVTGLTSVGLPASGSVTIRTYRFDWAGTYNQVNAPVDLGLYTHQYTNNQVTFFVAPATKETAYAFEFQ